MDQLSAVQVQAITESHAYVRSFHPGYEKEKGEALARLYFGSAKQNGYCLNFDAVWQLCGYKRKHGAKAKLISKRLRLEEDRDYEIRPLSEAELSRQGGQNREDIWLTSRGFCQFALAAQTDQGTALRDFMQFLTVRVESLMSALAAGKIEIRAVPTKDDSKRSDNRLRAAESQKSLTCIINELGYKDGRTFMLVNGETNYTVTGKRKKDLVNSLQRDGNLGTKRTRKSRKGTKRKGGKVVPRNGSDINSRNHMTPLQLALVNVIEVASAQEIAEKSNNDPNFSKCNLLDTHKEVCVTTIHPKRLAKARGENLLPALRIMDAKKDVCSAYLMEDDAPVQKNKLTSYFRSV